MPHCRYIGKRLTLNGLLEAVETGAYIVDLDKGTIVSRRTKKELFMHNRVYPPKEPGHWFVRLYYKGHFICTSRARIIWMLGHRREVPEDFEIHHKDEDAESDGFENLICIYGPDHKKLHRNGKATDPPF